MRRILVTGVLAAAAVAISVPAAQAAPAGEPVPAPPFDYAAGDVCPFPVHGSFPVNEQRGYTVTGRDGSTYEVVTGRLVGAFTNKATGKTVRRDLSGDGLTVTRPDGSLLLAVDGAAFVGLHGGDRPAHQMEINGPHSQLIVTFTADGVRTRVVQRGPYEDLCRTLAS